MLTLIMSGCTGDDTPEDNRTMHLMTASQLFTETTTQVTRALPAGYEVLDMSTTTAFPNSKDMLAFITPEKDNPTSSDIFIRRFTYFNDWQTNITIKDATTPYYIYGFIPLGDDTSDEVAISLLSGKTSYKDGAKLTIKRLKAMTASDVCIISGIKKTNASTDDIVNAGIVPGQFEYQFNNSSENPDYAYMLLDHLYAKVNLQMCIDETYNTLRTIKVRQIKLQLLNPDNREQGLNNVTAEVTLTANTTGSNPVTGITFTTNATGGEPMTVFTDNSGQMLTTDYVNIGIPAYTLFKAPDNATVKNQYIRIVSDYDVYDKSDNLIREVRNLQNTFTLGLTSPNQKAGLAHIIKMKVQPTYLYVLSEPDLDSPTITTES